MSSEKQNADWRLMTFYSCPKESNVDNIANHITGISIQTPCTRAKAVETAVRDIKALYHNSESIRPYELQYDPKVERLLDVDFNAIAELSKETIFFCMFNAEDRVTDHISERRKQAPTPPNRPKKLLRFEEFPDWLRKNIKIVPSGCWIWIGRINENGYGHITYEEERWPAHRLVYSFSAGYLENQFLLRHECDNRMCVAPHHLIPGNVYTNSDDVIARDRTDLKKFGRPMLLDHHLRLKEVRQIRIEYYIHDRPIRSIAREFKTGDNMIKSIVNYKIQFR